MTEPFQYETNGRKWHTALIVGIIWLALLYAWTRLEAASWIIALIVVFTLPAVWDIYANRRAGFSVDARSLRWYAGRGKAEMPLAEVDYVRLDTRLDFSVRATVFPKQGRKVRLPYESTPPDALLEATLNAHGIRTERHHFTLMQ